MRPRRRGNAEAEGPPIEESSSVVSSPVKSTEVQLPKRGRPKKSLVVEGDDLTATPDVIHEPVVSSSTEPPTSGRSRRSRGTEGNLCPYCPFNAHNTPALLLAHLRNDHPGLKAVKREPVDVDEAAAGAQPEQIDVTPSPVKRPPRHKKKKIFEADGDPVDQLLDSSPPAAKKVAPNTPAILRNGPKKSAAPAEPKAVVVADVPNVTLPTPEKKVPPIKATRPKKPPPMNAEAAMTPIPIGENWEELDVVAEQPLAPQTSTSRMYIDDIRTTGPRSQQPYVRQVHIDVVDENTVIDEQEITEEYVDEEMITEEYVEEMSSGIKQPHGDENRYVGDARYTTMMPMRVAVLGDYGDDYDVIDVEGQNDEIYAKEEAMYHMEGLGGNRARPSRHNPLGDPNGRYPCYIETCKWRGNFRSVRCTHMRNAHPDWVRPPRFVLNRIARDGTVLQANDASARYSCFIDGCPWRGNYRASRSNHMKTQHKGWIPKRTRAANGGFVANGRYSCHVEECGWRGMSRSTRAVHMKREHPGFVNPIYTPRNIPCTDCGSSMTSHKLFVDHMVVDHRIGGIVQREFLDVREYEDWFEAVQDSFSIDFIKKMGMKNGPNYQILYLYCARSGGYCPTNGYDKKLDPMGIYEPRYAKHLRRRDKCGRNCAAFLRVMHWNDGRLSIIGCVEHTGHRLGTALLRLSPIEREAMDEYLYMMEESTPLELIIERLREIEGLTANECYEPQQRSADFGRQFVRADREHESLQKLLVDQETYPASSVFAVNPPREGQWTFTFGYIDEQMANNWKTYAHKGVCIDEVRLMLGEWDLRVTLVLVFDEEQYVRVAALYINDSPDKRPLFDKLTQIWSGEVQTFVTDCSDDYPALLDRYFGEYQPEGMLDLQFAEWHLLSEWSNSVDQLVVNRVDKYGIMCAMRRLLRTADNRVFEQTINELFEALREMQLDEVAQFVDNQLEPSFLKRWSPNERNPLTEHSNPNLEFACRMLRERYISCEQCSRIDEYLGYLVARVVEYNGSPLFPIENTREPDPPRELPQNYIEMALDGCEMTGPAVRHELVDDDDEEWEFQGTVPDGEPQPRFLGIEERRNYLMRDSQQIHEDLENSLSKEDAMMSEKPEIIEEVVEEEIVLAFDQAELVEQMMQNGELIMDEETETLVQPSGKKQRLLDMVNSLTGSLQNIPDEELELVGGSIEEVVEKVAAATPQKAKD
ncbi:unnamed protein product, partial [Mesorhabditis spiculigera]